MVDEGTITSNDPPVIERIVWIDIFKAVCIILMVVGHAWGGLNIYIYQFHMAAFFFISGYSTNTARKSLDTVVFNKARHLLVPLFVMIIIMSPLAHMIDGWEPAQAFSNLEKDLRDFLIWGARVNLLGATWFLEALFWVFLIQWLIRSLTFRWGGMWMHLIATLAVFCLGYYLWGYNYREPHFVDVALIAQVYFGIGMFLRETDILKKVPDNRMLLIIALVCGTMMWAVTHLDAQYTMDMVSRVYPSILVLLVVPFFGTGLVYSASCLISKVSGTIKDLMVALGRETLGVLFLHFACFKIATLLFVVLGMATLSDLKVFLIPGFASGIPWLCAVYLVISVISSVLIWKLLKSVPVLGKLLGGE